MFDAGPWVDCRIFDPGPLAVADMMNAMTTSPVDQCLGMWTSANELLHTTEGEMVRTRVDVPFASRSDHVA